MNVIRTQQLTKTYVTDPGRAADGEARQEAPERGGEMSGKLEPMLERAARLETQALERRLAVFLTLLEPAMILVMGAAVLLIVLAILLPIIQLNQLVR